jgi:hypothetical protein
MSSESVLRNRAAKRKILDAFKSEKGCYYCGESEAVVLDFHHVFDKRFTVTSALETHKSLDEILTEIRKCVILCANDHRRVHKKLLPLPQIDEGYHRSLDNVVTKVVRQIPTCIDCGTQVYGIGTRCRVCAGRVKEKTNWPDNDTLRGLIKTKGFSGVARLYNVSEAAVRKRKRNHLS